MRPVLAFVLLLLLAQLCRPMWTEEVAVRVSDANGKPVENAQVVITYQNNSALSDNDGVVSGDTGADGYFRANISNRLPAAYEITAFKVKASTYYWSGSTATGNANNSTANIDFTNPFELEPLSVKVISGQKMPIGGASAYLTNNGVVAAKKTTAANGIAAFQVPKGLPFAGFASFGNETQKFTSGNDTYAAGTHSVTVTLPQKRPAPGTNGTVNPNAANSIQLTIIGKDGKPVPFQPVVFTFEEKNTSISTDASGVVAFSSNSSGPLNASIQRYEYPYRFELQLSGASSQSLELKPLLNITSFGKIEESENCYLLEAHVEDPRYNLPIQVAMSKYGPSANNTMEVQSDENGVFTSRLCIRTDTQVKATASNKYDSAEAVLALVYKKKEAQPVVPPPAAGGNVTKRNLTTSIAVQITPQQKQEQDDAFFGIVATLVVVSLLAGLLFARRYLTMILRYIIEYLRQMWENIERKKRGMPPVKPPV